ncbi:MAG: hypothetical protein FJ271_11430 [Planctomycetes bacterium]|nr:hypothetical protein [Planctomycetota bacterium]
MPQPTVEQRLAKLEEQVQQLESERANGSRRPDWRRTIGIFTDDPSMQQLFSEAMRIREADRKKARRKRRSKKP